MSDESATELHRILARQLRKSGINRGDPPSAAAFEKFLTLISNTYTETEQAQELNDRALNLASAEMQELYDNMEGLVRERTQEIEQAQAELIAINEQLQTQSQELEQQHESIQRTNVELELKTEALDIEKARLQDRNVELAAAMETLEMRANQLAQMSQYKSAFLASMSHELRTPLNSLLILADILTRNEEGNLTEDQVESLQTIHDAGSDLLALINQILDLAKIESGGMTLEVSEASIAGLLNSVESIIAPIAANKGIGFRATADPNAVDVITTDATKVGQILKNLLSNACKFTETGEVTIAVVQATADELRANAPALPASTAHIAIAVRDSGIGIEPGLQEQIFEAFKQGDSGTARRFGGTGLGLAISRELARLLGGDIHLDSVVGVGSTFTLYLPVRFEHSTVVAEAEPHTRGTATLDTADEIAAARAAAAAAQTQERPESTSRTLLIVEDDARFADIVRREAQAHGFQPVVATDGISALKFASENQLVAMTLDLRLPDMNGWQILAAIQSDPKQARFPVLVMSVDDETNTRTATDVFRYLTKPTSRTDLQLSLRELARMTLPESASQSGSRSVLLVVPDAAEKAVLSHKLKAEGIATEAVTSGPDAIAELARRKPGAVIVDLATDGGEGVTLVESIHSRHPELPIISLTEAQLSPLESKILADACKTTVHKGPRVFERIVDEVSLHFHGAGEPNGESSAAEPSGGDGAGRSTRSLDGVTLLVVDDDQRNIFALKKLLQQQGCFVLEAHNGREAVEVLAETDGIDGVLMDIMMPEMDGYEAMRIIRSQEQFANMPIIALTALAMAEDKDKCIDAGANDYVSKPIDSQRLLSLLSLWLQRK